MNRPNRKIYFVFFFLTLILFTSSVSKADYYGWRALSNSRFNNEIKAVEVYNNEIIASGKFSSISGSTIHGIARWVTDHWEPMGGDPGCEVYTLFEWNGKLIAGGKFSTINGVAANNIASWNGSIWEALGNGLNGDVFALTQYNGDLTAGGKFTSSGSTQTRRVAIWNGSSWSEPGSGLNNDVHALTVYSGKLIAGGKFTGRVARYSGNIWNTVAGGLDNDVNTFTQFSGELIAGGKFTKNIARLVEDDNSGDGEWQVLGGGVSDEVFCLYEESGKLIVGGNFLYAGNVSNNFYVNRIAKWSGSSWGRYSTGMSGTINALKSHNSMLFAGGNFWAAGGDTAYNIAVWKQVPYRTIQGKVKYRDNNQPVLTGKVYSVKLDAYTKRVMYIDTAIINNLGEYILNKVPVGEGDLLICFPSDEDDNNSGFAGADFIPSYYPEGISWMGATKLNINQNHSNIEIKVDRTVTPLPIPLTASLTGTAHLNFIPPGYPAGSGFDFKSGTAVYLSRLDGFYAFDVSNNNENFNIDSLETGAYTLTADRYGYGGITMQLIITQGTNVNFSLDTISTVTVLGNFNSIPKEYKLHQNYPNPFNPSTIIRFDIQKSTNVKLKIYDALGREVHTIVNSYLNPGSYEAKWFARNMSSGIYYYYLQAGDYIESKRMVLVK